MADLPRLRFPKCWQRTAVQVAQAMCATASWFALGYFLGIAAIGVADTAPKPWRFAAWVATALTFVAVIVLASRGAEAVRTRRGGTTPNPQRSTHS